MRLALAAFQVAVLTFLTFLLVQGDGPGSRETFLVFSRDHGLNLGDLPVLGLWALGVAVSVLTYRRAR